MLTSSSFWQGESWRPGEVIWHPKQESPDPKISVSPCNWGPKRREVWWRTLARPTQCCGPFSSDELGGGLRRLNDALRAMEQRPQLGQGVDQGENLLPVGKDFEMGISALR